MMQTYFTKSIGKMMNRLWYQKSRWI